MKIFKSKKFVAAVIIILLALFWWFETFTIAVSPITIKSEKIKNRMTIVHLSDLHGAIFGSDNKNLLLKINAQNPDIIVVTGDMYTHGDERGMKTVIKLLSKLAEFYPVYCVNGEHDKNEEFFTSLREVGVSVLDYKKENVTVKGNEINIYGITNVYYASEFHLSKYFDPVDSNSYNILLAHIENFPEFSAFGMDLSLCGDSHGGQIRLPFVGALINRGIWFPEVTDSEAKYTKGLYSDGTNSVIVSGGLGNYPVPIRLFNRPEITVITLEPQG